MKLTEFIAAYPVIPKYFFPTQRIRRIQGAIVTEHIVYMRNVGNETFQEMHDTKNPNLNGQASARDWYVKEFQLSKGIL